MLNGRVMSKKLNRTSGSVEFHLVTRTGIEPMLPP